MISTGYERNQSQQRGMDLSAGDAFRFILSEYAPQVDSQASTVENMGPSWWDGKEVPAWEEDQDTGRGEDKDAGWGENCFTGWEDNRTTGWEEKETMSWDEKEMVEDEEEAEMQTKEGDENEDEEDGEVKWADSDNSTLDLGLLPVLPRALDRALDLGWDLSPFDIPTSS
ncbi:hypothetical protein BKA93DRAFT_520725 [Sparassis latifolia]